MKTCTKCGRRLPYGEFYRLSSGGRRADCSDCSRAAANDRNRRVRREAAVRRAQAEAAAKLLVTPSITRLPDGDVGSLLVDAEALMTNDLGPRYWRLHPGDNPGEWTCPGPGTAGPLSEMLRGIADSYLDREAVAS